MGFFKLHTELLLNNCWNKLNRVWNARDLVSIDRSATWRSVFVAKRAIDIRSRGFGENEYETLAASRMRFLQIKNSLRCQQAICGSRKYNFDSTFFFCFAVKCAIKEQKIPWKSSDMFIILSLAQKHLFRCQENSARGNTIRAKNGNEMESAHCEFCWRTLDLRTL